MWHDASSRALDLKGPKGFALPGAQRRYAPDRQADVSRVRVEIWVDPAVPRIRGAVLLELLALMPTSRIELDAEELEIAEVRDAGGRTLPYTVEDSKVIVSLERTIPPGEAFALTIDYSGAPRRGLYFIGPSAFDPDRPREVWTQGQDDDSRHWFPCFDHPNQKATTELVAHVPPGTFALSNGVLVERREEPEGHVFFYRQDIPHSTYLVTLVVGDYIPIEHPGARVPVVSYVHPRHEAEGRLTFQRTAEMVELFSEKIGVAYPYPRYAQICVADFIFGGMENTAATTLTEQILHDRRAEADYHRIAESLVAHELAHQWWGDLVTCSDWSHAWLNEGFATYFETVWREHREGPSEAAYARLLDQEAYFQEGYRRPLVERVYEEPIDLFDRHQYEKGSAVLHLMRFILGDGAFWRTLRHYAERHRGKSAESSDLRKTVLEVTGKNLESFFDQWVYAPGHPHITLSGAYDAEDQAFNLLVEQTQRGDRVPEAFAFPVDIEVTTEAGTEVHRVRIEQRKQSVRLPSATRPLSVLFDRGGHILKQVENRLPSTMLRALLERTDDVHAAVLAARTLSKRQDPASLKAVTRALASHRAPGVRAEAARALRRAPHPEVEEALFGALSDPDSRVRRAAARALSGFKERAEAITERLVGLTEREASDYVLADMVRTVGDLRSARAAAFVKGALEMTGHNHCIRAAAVEALAKLRDVSALPEVARRVEPGQHARVREAAVSALGALGRFAAPSSLQRAEVHERLAQLLGDPWLRVRMRAAEALRALGEKTALSELREHAERELDGRARRVMRLAEREIREDAHATEEVERLRDEVRSLEQAHAKVSDRLDKLEGKRRDRRVTTEAKPAPEPEPKSKKKKGEKKSSKRG